MVLTVKLPAGAKWLLPAATGSGPAASLNRNVYFYAGGGVSVGGTSLSSHAKLKARLLAQSPQTGAPHAAISTPHAHAELRDPLSRVGPEPP